MHRFSTQLQLLYPTFPLLWSMAYKQLECDLLLWGSRAIYGCVSYWRIAGRVYPKGKHSLAEGENRQSPLLSLVPSSLFHVILPSVPSGHPLSLFLLSLSPCLSPAIPTGASHYYPRSSLSSPLLSSCLSFSSPASRSFLVSILDLTPVPPWLRVGHILPNFLIDRESYSAFLVLELPRWISICSVSIVLRLFVFQYPMPLALPSRTMEYQPYRRHLLLWPRLSFDRLVCLSVTLTRPHTSAAAQSDGIGLARGRSNASKV